MSPRGRLVPIICAIAVLAVPAAASAKTKSVPAGVYEGTGHLTGGFANSAVDVKVNSGGVFKFCVANNSGTGVKEKDGHWAIEPTTVTVDEKNGLGTGRGDMDGFGTLYKYHGALIADGAENFQFTIDVEGFTFMEPLSVPVEDEPVDISKITSNGFSGDVALPVTKAQQQEGLSSTEKGKYTAKRVKSCALASPPKLG